MIYAKHNIFIITRSTAPAVERVELRGSLYTDENLNNTITFTSYL